MTTEDLRDELARIAGDAPVAAVAPDTWGRARRARTRDRVVGVLGTVAAVALVAGLAAAVMPRLDELPVASGDGLGVPDRLYAVPTHMSERSGDEERSRDEVIDDVATGRAAAVWTSGDLPVVVDADDGDYHLLELPGFAGNDVQVTTYASELGLALSPDGRRLAYAWGDPGPDDVDRPVPSGVRVLDLDTGDVREVPVEGGEGTLVNRLRFSPDGRWLVWTGRQLASWTEGSIGGGSAVAGRIAPGAAGSTPISGFRPALSDAAGDLTVADTGLVVAVSESGARGTAVVQRWNGRFLGRARLTRGDGTPLGTALQDTISSSPDGRLVAIGSCCTRSAYVADTTTGEVVTTARLDYQGSLAGASPLGWVDADTSVWQVMPQGEGDGSLTFVDVDGSARNVGTVEDSVFVRSVATDLMSPRQPTVARPAPNWPWSTTRHLVVWCSVAALAFLGLVAVGARRRVWVLPRLTLSPPPLGLTGPEGLLLGAVGAAGLSLGWAFLVGTSADDAIGTDVADLMVFAMPAAIVVAGAALLLFRGWRWWGVGLVVGPPAGWLVLGYIVLSQLSSG